MWEAALAEHRPYPAYLVEQDGAWGAIGWEEAGRAVDEIAAGFLSLGLARGDRVAILCGTRLEWTLCDLALAGIGVVTVPVYPTSSAIECAYILGNAGARAVVCESPEHVSRISPLRAELDALDHVVAVESVPGITSLDEVRQRGRDFASSQPSALATARSSIGAGDLLTILYTSGTTGAPKGCLLTQRHFRVMVDMLAGVEGFFEGRDRVLLFLPLAHNFARLVQFAGAGIGFTIAYCDPSRVLDALPAVRPTILPSVPRLFEKLQASVESTLAEATGVRRSIAARALAVGSRAARLREAGRPVPRSIALQVAVADRLVFSRVRARLGGELRLAVSGGAPLARSVAEYLHGLGILVLEGYGLTECTTASHVNRPGRYRFGTVGLPLPGVECRIDDDGEVLLHGANVFAGYQGDERATRAALTNDGWLRTGDVGSIDSDGFLTITDRKKDLIITSGGKNVSPQNVESALKTSPLVSHALVVGDRRPYVVALVSLDREAVERAGLSEADARTRVEEAVAAANSSLARPAQVRRFAVLDRDFRPELGEVTPTLKLRRHVCEEHFRDVIEELY
jgi:long-chain acyl-CoA synthetase